MMTNLTKKLLCFWNWGEPLFPCSICQKTFILRIKKRIKLKGQIRKWQLKKEITVVQLSIEALKCHICCQMSPLRDHWQHLWQSESLPPGQNVIQNVCLVCSEKQTKTKKQSQSPKKQNIIHRKSVQFIQVEKRTMTRHVSPVRCSVAHHEATVYIPAAKNSIPDHCDSSQASHVTQSCLVHSCGLNSLTVQRSECLQ